MYPRLKSLNHALILMCMLALSGCILTEEPPTHRNKSAPAADVTSTDTASHDAADAIDTIACTPGGNECKSHEKLNQLSTCSGESRTCLFRCTQDYQDCDGDRANGCETYLGDVDSCGACANTCTRDVDHFARTCTRQNAGAPSSFRCGIDRNECEEGFERVESAGVVTCVAPE